MSMFEESSSQSNKKDDTSSGNHEHLNKIFVDEIIQ